MSNRLFVTTDDADSLLEQMLPNAFLAGTKITDTLVRIDDEGDPADLAFELGWYADRLPISHMEVHPHNWNPEDPVVSAENTRPTKLSNGSDQ